MEMGGGGGCLFADFGINTPSVFNNTEEAKQQSYTNGQNNIPGTRFY